MDAWILGDRKGSVVNQKVIVIEILGILGTECGVPGLGET